MLGQGQQSVADGVAGRLVARHHQQDEEGGDLLRGQRLPVHIGVDQGGDHVVGRVAPAGVGQRGHEHGQRLRRRHEGQHGIGALGDVLGVAVGEDDVGGLEDGVVVGRPDAHHVADDLEREAGRHLDHEVATALRGHPVDDVVGHEVDPVLNALDHARVEGGRHDAAQACVARVVHVDHRPEEVEHLHRQVGNGGGAPAGNEDLGVPARLRDIGMARHGPVARALRHDERELLGDVGLLEEGHGPLAPQRQERALALLPRPGPELHVGQVDGIE